MAFTDKVSADTENAELKKIIKDLKKDVDTLRDDMGKLNKDAMHFGEASYKNAQHGIEDTAEKVMKKTREKGEDLKHDAEEATASFRKTIREYPVASLGVATAIGMILGRRLLK